MTNLEVNYHFLDVDGDFGHYDNNRSNFQRIFGSFLRSEPGISRRVLDIGCGHGVNPSFEFFVEQLGQLDGVDPFPVIAPPEHLVNRWTCALENIPVSASTYDIAYSYNVVEHVEDIGPFLKKAIDVIKPGAAYWSMCPNARHPFTWVTILIQRLGLTNIYRKRVNHHANEYPAFYNLSNDRKVLSALKEMQLPVSRVDFYYIPNVQWDMYFPNKLRAIAHFLDRLIILRRQKMSFVFMFRIQKM